MKLGYGFTLIPGYQMLTLEASSVWCSSDAFLSTLVFVALFEMFLTMHRHVHSETHFPSAAYSLYPVKNKIHEDFLQIAAGYAEIYI